MPLIVYLDTQDYINIFNEKNEDGQQHQILKELMSFRERGEIVIGFSYLIILEFITKPGDDIHKLERSYRGKLIKDICGPNAFPYLTDLAKGAVFPNDGRWFPGHNDKTFLAGRQKRLRNKMWISGIKRNKNLSSKERRQQSNISSLFKFSRNQPNWDRETFDNKGIPASDEIIENHIWESFMRGQVDNAEFKKIMDRWHSDPAEFSHIFYEYGNHMNIIDDYFGNIKIGFEESIEQTKKTFGNNAKNINVEIQKIIDQISIPKFNRQNNNVKFKNIFKEKYLEHFNLYFLRAVKSGHTFKSSDMMDLMHMCYAYDCDLFRCDKSMGSIFENYESFQDKLVSKFHYLPERIEEKLIKLDSTSMPSH